MKKIKISNKPSYLTVDDDDYEKCRLFKWSENSNGGMYTRIGRKIVNIANFLTGEYDTKFDHADRNPRNNSKSNLRICTHSQNGANKAKQKNCASIHKGVSWDAAKNKWAAYITANHKHIFIGYFSDEIEAAKAYNRAAVYYFKEFAVLNKVEVDQL